MRNHVLLYKQAEGYKLLNMYAKSPGAATPGLFHTVLSGCQPHINIYNIVGIYLQYHVLLCYNTTRQKNQIFIMYAKSPGVAAPGLFYTVLSGWFKPQADYRSLSPLSHLQIQQATILAATETIKEPNRFIMYTHFLYLSRGGSIINIS